MKGLKLFTLSIGLMTSFCACNNAFCAQPNVGDLRQEKEAQPYKTLQEAEAAFNILKEQVSEYESQLPKIESELDRNSVMDDYFFFRKQIGKIFKGLSSLSNEDGVNAFKNSLQKYDEFLTRQWNDIGQMRI